MPSLLSSFFSATTNTNRLLSRTKKAEGATKAKENGKARRGIFGRKKPTKQEEKHVEPAAMKVLSIEPVVKETPNEKILEEMSPRSTRSVRSIEPPADKVDDSSVDTRDPDEDKPKAKTPTGNKVRKMEPESEVTIVDNYPTSTERDQPEETAPPPPATPAKTGLLCGCI